MSTKPPPKKSDQHLSSQKLTDAERHKRFVDMAKEVEASDDPNEFEKALKKVAKPQ